MILAILLRSEKIVTKLLACATSHLHRTVLPSNISCTEVKRSEITLKIDLLSIQRWIAFCGGS